MCGHLSKYHSVQCRVEILPVVSCPLPSHPSSQAPDVSLTVHGSHEPWKQVSEAGMACLRNGQDGHTKEPGRVECHKPWAVFQGGEPEALVLLCLRCLIIPGLLWLHFCTTHLGILHAFSTHGCALPGKRLLNCLVAMVGPARGWAQTEWILCQAASTRMSAQSWGTWVLVLPKSRQAWSYKEEALTSLILQRKKLRLREVEQLTQNHTASK